MEGNFNVRKWRTSINNLQEFINRQEQSKSSDEKVLGILEMRILMFLLLI